MKVLGLGTNDKEKLVVEFEVERTVKRDYGYEEKYLMYGGQSIPYKAIIKDGKVLAIVSRFYRLLENEKVEQIVRRWADHNNYEVKDVRYEGARLHAIVVSGTGDGIVVHNSVDGSMAFRADAILDVGDAMAIFKTKELGGIVYRKHTKNLDEFVKQCGKMFDEVLKACRKYREFLRLLDERYAKEYERAIIALRDVMPKKCVASALVRVVYGDAQITLMDVYRMIAQRIWADREHSFKRKVELFEELNKTFAAMVMFEL